MNQIELITGLPNWRFKEHSQNEIALNGAELVECSDYIYQIGNAAVCGFIYQSFVNPPWMWFVLAEDISIGDLNDFRRCKNYIPQGSLTAIAADFELALRFAKLYGFELTGEDQDYFGRRYLIARKR